MLIDQQPTAIMYAIVPQRRPVYPRPRRKEAAMLIVRIVSLLALLSILTTSGLLYFATPNTIGMFDAKPTPTDAPCARVTLIQSQGTLTTKIDEVC